MTAKDKAKELYCEYIDAHSYNRILKVDDYVFAKQCALIVVAEVYKLKLRVGAYLDTDPDKEMYYSYWEDVKLEIEKM